MSTAARNARIRGNGKRCQLGELRTNSARNLIETTSLCRLDYTDTLLTQHLHFFILML